MSLFKVFSFSAAALVVSATSFSHAGEITCFGRDGAGQTFIVQFAEFDKYGVGTMSAETVRGVQRISNVASLSTAKGKSAKSFRQKGDIYVDGQQAAMILDQNGRQSYVGLFCGPHDNTVVGGVKFTNSDCLQVECKSNGLSVLGR